MCGIVAIFDPAGGVDRRDLEAALVAMRHRGPDGSGIWISDDRRIGVGHVRLSVIDLETGDQPIVEPSSGVVISVNGELYGYEEIRRRLVKEGARFQTASDSEILLHLYRRAGTACLEALRGEFAFVLWDPQRGLFAGRDRFGIKPLMFCRKGERLLIASEAAALFAAGVSARWDPAAFFHAAHLQYPPADRTLFAGVEQVEAGHYLLADGKQVCLRRYWDLDFPREDERAPEPELDQIQALAAALDEAVALRMVADVPVACQLSGGLDSSSVAGLAAHLQSEPVHCFTVAFDRPPYDERVIAEDSAKRLGAVLHQVPLSQLELAEALPAAVARTESLVVNAHVAAKYLLSRAVRDAGFKVVLAGEGADEVFAGYPHFRRDLYRDDPAALAALTADNPVSTGVLLPEGHTLDTGAVRAALSFVPGFLEAKASLGYRHRALLDPDFLQAFDGRDVYRELLERVDVQEQLEGRHPVDQAAYLWAKLALPNYLLRIMGDGAEMAHSVEGRLPFLDHHLFAVARGIPPTRKIRAGVEKHILREAVRGRVSDSVYRRRKHPFFAPPLGSPGGSRVREVVGDLLGSAAFRAVPFYDHRKIHDLFESVHRDEPEKTRAGDPLVLMAMSAGILQERFGL